VREYKVIQSKDKITNRVCCGKINSQAASSSAKQKDEYVRSET